MSTPSERRAEWLFRLAVIGLSALWLGTAPGPAGNTQPAPAPQAASNLQTVAAGTASETTR